ncbi:hypothetical protein DSC45_01665 [Streptomyces sp. YIM 130001]|uniref:hypothetical protein n=1 Tax=Streptomyces sp. YIM 130001 TaxID=2259644 RepID=UPI000E64E0E6|nr:hypothetical protein [Streptomyces sp. YIM 130001]RII20809.1 hypothetical protein DSC45_01665 [Streptomyces sp. YIM 130001]
MTDEDGNAPPRKAGPERTPQDDRGEGETQGTGLESHGGRETQDEEGAASPELRRELVELGRQLRHPDLHGETMAEQVLARIVAESVATPVRVAPSHSERLRGWLRRHRRGITATLCGLLTVTAVTPPVRAAVGEWIGFGGVAVRHDPSADAPDSDDDQPARRDGCGGLIPLPDAGRLAGFAPVLPEELGAPTAAAVTIHGPGHRRVLTVCWTGGAHGPIRLEQFPASIDPLFWKTTRARYEQVQAAGINGLWFPEVHTLELRLLGPDGHGYRRLTHPAGPTLVWQVQGRTLRLEGESSRERAIEIAKSAGSGRDRG